MRRGVWWRQAFLEEGQITVTPTGRIVIGGRTYPVANLRPSITNVCPQPVGRTFILGGFLLFGLSDSVRAFLIGAILLVVAIVWWRQAKSTRHLLRLAGGERRALESEDADYVDRVARAALIAGR